LLFAMVLRQLLETGFDRREMIELTARLVGAGAVVAAAAAVSPRLAFASDTKYFADEFEKNNPRVSVDVGAGSYWVAFVDGPEIPILGPDNVQQGVFTADAAVPRDGALLQTYVLKKGVLQPDEAITLPQQLYGSGLIFTAPNGVAGCRAKIGNESAFVLANPLDTPKMRHLTLAYEGGVARHTRG
jgi:hypothetical protein